MKVLHVSIMVNDIDESINFYKKFLGFNLIEIFEKKKLKARVAVLKLNDFFIELWQFSKKKKSKFILSDINFRKNHIAFEVKNIINVVKNFKSNKIKIFEPEIGVDNHKFCYFFDPSGNVLELNEK